MDSPNTNKHSDCVVTYIIVVSSGGYADNIIRSIVHVPPERLPDAQRIVTLILSVETWVWVMFAVYYIAALVSFSLLTSRSRLAGDPLIIFRDGTRAVLLLTPVLAVLCYGSGAVTAAFRPVVPDREHGGQAGLLVHPSCKIGPQICPICAVAKMILVHLFAQIYRLTNQ